MSLQDTKRTNKKKGDQTKNSRRRSNEEKTLFAEILADKDNKFLLVIDKLALKYPEIEMKKNNVTVKEEDLKKISLTKKLDIFITKL